MMQQPALLLDDQVTLVARLRQFLNWLLAAIGCIAMLQAIVAVRTPLIQTTIGTSVTCGFLLLLLLARAFMRQRPVFAAMTISMGFFGVAIVDALVLPLALPVLIFLPVLSVAMTLPYLDRQGLRNLSIAATLTTTLVGGIVEFVPLFTMNPQLQNRVNLIVAATLMSGLTLFLLSQHHRRQTETLAGVKAANADLEVARAGLEAEVCTRTADLRAALGEVEIRAASQARLLEENALQREVIRDLSVPVLPVTATTLVMPLVGALDTVRLQHVQEQALRAIERINARQLILDITGVPLVDSQVAQGLLAVVQAVRLLGAEAVLVGVRPEVAQAIVGLGQMLPGLHTFADLQTALGRLVVWPANEQHRKQFAATRDFGGSHAR